jgi:predicted nucleotidyltransferase
LRSRSPHSVRVYYPELNREQVIARLSDHLPALAQQLPLCRVVLFGSYARGNYTASSDIDVLVVYGGHKRDDAFRVVKKGLPIRGLEPHVYSEAEFEAVQDTFDRMLQGGIPLLG